MAVNTCDIFPQRPGACIGMDEIEANLHYWTQIAAGNLVEMGDGPVKDAPPPNVIILADRRSRPLPSPSS